MTPPLHPENVMVLAWLIVNTFIFPTAELNMSRHCEVIVVLVCLVTIVMVWRPGI